MTALRWPVWLGLVAFGIAATVGWSFCPFLANALSRFEKVDLVASAFIPSPADSSLVPTAIEATSDSAIVVAGSLDILGRPWAAKVDTEGRLIWRYVEPDNLPDIDPGKIILGGYSAIAPMPDGSVFLCGRVKSRYGSSGNTITHIDKDGSRLSDFFIPDRGGLFWVKACVAFKGGIMLMGGGSSKFAAVFVRDNKIVWRTSDDGYSHLFFVSAYEASSSAVNNGSDVTLSLTDNQATAVVTVDGTGNIVRHLIFSGGFLGMHGTGGDKSVFLFGPRTSGDSGMYEIRHLESAGILRTVMRQRSLTSFEPISVFRLANGSLAFFGESIHKFGPSHKAAVARTSADLREEDIYDLENSTDGDGGMIRASARLGGDEFAIARLKMFPGKYGAVIDFIRLK